VDECFGDGAKGESSRVIGVDEYHRLAAITTFSKSHTERDSAQKRHAQAGRHLLATAGAKQVNEVTVKGPSRHCFDDTGYLLADLSGY
jgi:hypothetical protein